MNRLIKFYHEETFSARIIITCFVMIFGLTTILTIVNPINLVIIGGFLVTVWTLTGLRIRAINRR